MGTDTQPLDSLLGLGSARAVLLKPPTEATVNVRSIAIDPGRTSGLVIVVPRVSHLVAHDWIVVETSDILVIWHVLNTYYPKEIIVERFDPQELPVNLDAIGILKIIDLWVLINPRAHALIWRQPRDVMNLCSDEFLRQNGLWVRGFKHGRDAVRHLCWHLIERKGNTSLLEWTRANQE